MWLNERISEGAARTALRRQREDDAPRLLDEAQGLQSFFISLTESDQQSADPASRYIRRFVLATAPALFIFPCGDHKCRGGGHDITPMILAGLRGHQSRTEGENRCAGLKGEVSCTRVLHFEAVAAFA
jgi:hypothetical protein